ncbi:transcription elongation factor GreA [Candidatus Roizmanbacteria bacterium CG_4_8_14_3_um_filter_34_9]|uniref:Transcription elongation factor GreA n=3 Tax=Candidatus Roizmaniibacteriota TaxID=1752723 RepID=A0A2M7AU12_9BACT|nr:MAG: transcription elongation factor GreA [Candidatus Roizmanbacteria bacterium CG07_land_8_20_14_0_80_34_15]PIU74097.1 MAG: transcription elongation factor GreA [Candidatus Roizmanbacteria bacterium CG06_land_8_20_14_3_00_34_14]PIW73272.1 MAG: transcription elongation factor GreA [Candidatus Roizmanbacteria bacterium CG_4_8_14_3_um_filter_34_9]
MTKIQLTQKGFNDLQLELEDLIKNKKSKAIDRLSKARSMGDLKENSEYTAAKEELALVEGRIQEINNVLSNAEVTLMYKAGNKIEIGSTVTVDINGQKDTFQIVGEFEADPMNKKLSQNSPIGQALINKKIGDLVEINIPAGKIQYKIIEIK